MNITNTRMRNAIILICATCLLGISFLLLQSKVNVVADPVEEKRLTQKSARKESFGALESGHSPLVIREEVEGKSLDPLSAKQLMADFCAANSNLRERADYCAQMIADLCKAGYSNEAWDLIDESHGMVRIKQLAEFFGYAALSPDDLMDKMASLDPKSDFRAAFNGFALRYSLGELEGLVASEKFSSSTKEFKRNQISGTLSGALQLALLRSDPKDIDSVIFSAERWHEQGWLNTIGLMGFLRSKKIEDPFKKWDTIKDIVDEAQWDGEAKLQRASLIGDMVTEDASGALGRFLEVDGRLASDDIYRAVSYWSKLDSEGLASWYRSNQESFTPGQINSLASALSSVAMAAEEFESARLWAEQIQDDGLRERQLKSLEEKLTHLQDE